VSGRPRPSPVALVLTLAAVAASASACGRVDVPESLADAATTTTEVPTPAAEPQDPTCTDGVDGTVVESLRPDAAAADALASRTFPAGSYMAGIQARERLRVGVDTSTNLFSSVDPLTGEFEGFDVDIAREMARAVFGDEPYGIGLPPGHPEYVRFVNAALDQVRSSGRWIDIYDDHLEDILPSETGGQPPAARYED
jgi:polar amino acid transport system substrate-binding protein